MGRRGETPRASGELGGGAVGRGVGRWRLGQAQAVLGWKEGCVEARARVSGWRDRPGEEGRGRGKGEEAAVPSIPGPEEASSSCSPLWLEPPTIPDLASQCLAHGSPAPYL